MPDLTTAENTANPPQRTTVLPKWAYISLTTIAFSSVVFFTYYLVVQRPPIPQTTFFLLLVIYGLSAAFMFFGITEVIAEVTGSILGFAIKAGGPFAALVIIILLGLYVNSLPDKQHDLNVRIYGTDGPSDVPLKNIPNAIALIPSNRRGLISELNPYGIATFSLNETYEKDSMSFFLTVRNYELVDPGKKYKIDPGKELILNVRPLRAHYEFRFIDKDDFLPVPGVRFICQDLKVDTFSDSLGMIECQTDTIGKESYLFSIISPKGYARYKGQNEFLIMTTHPKFQLEKAHE